ncbi:MAG: response regulator [Lachnospiraceae bacterium]|nr:response regulator [Lachnospiraceae bacterium]
MYTKIIYVIIDCLAIASILITLNSTNKIREEYGTFLKKAMLFAIVSIISNIIVALSFYEKMAEIAYCIYFISIDWILYYLFIFILSYTEHHNAVKKLKFPAFIIMLLDSSSLLLNPVIKEHFYIYTNSSFAGTIFYQTGFKPLYYLHLAIDYTFLLIAICYIISRIIKNRGIYQIKYIILLSVILFIVILNIFYMTLGLVLDISVIFYAVAGALICFGIRTFVPHYLMTTSIGRVIDNMKEGLILFDINEKCIYANSFSINNFNINIPEYNFKCEPIATVINKNNNADTGVAIFTQNNADALTTDNRHFKIKYNRFNDNKNRPIGSYFLIEDITEDVFYLNEIKSARTSADNANNAKSAFLANMSHEIRTPLNSILGMNELIQRSANDPLIKEYSYNISTAGETLLSILNDVLDFSKIEAGKTNINSKDYDPYILLRNSYYFFIQSAEKKGLYIHVICDDELPSKLYGDSKLIGQILSNLISNAIKYTVNGGVTLNMTFDETDKDSIDLIIDITDTGIGINEKDIPYLFDSFSRFEQNDNYSVSGTGLGLAITKELTSLLNGNIIVKSSPGVGSRFTVIIPQKVSDHSPIGPLVNPDSSKSPEYKERFTAPSANILIVDDSKTNLIVTEGLLKSTMVTIDKALSGDEAIDKCMHIRYDLILLDHRMPLKDGIETFKIISQNGLNTNTPVVMLTANVVSGMDDEYKRIGFCDYITKPINPNELENTLLKHLPKDKVIINH